MFSLTTKNLFPRGLRTLTRKTVEQMQAQEAKDFAKVAATTKSQYCYGSGGHADPSIEPDFAAGQQQQSFDMSGGEQPQQVTLTKKEQRTEQYYLQQILKNNQESPKRLNTGEVENTISAIDGDHLFKKDNRIKFRINRTINGNLPIYERFRRGGCEAMTVIRLIEGDVDQLRKKLMMVCEAPCRVRTGCVELRGLHTWKIKEWLTSLGF